MQIEHGHVGVQAVHGMAEQRQPHGTEEGGGECKTGQRHGSGLRPFNGKKPLWEYFTRRAPRRSVFRSYCVRIACRCLRNASCGERATPTRSQSGVGTKPPAAPSPSVTALVTSG